MEKIDPFIIAHGQIYKNFKNYDFNNFKYKRL